MSDERRNTNSRFSDFEPDVDAANIDKSWERIKYFLPAEKKRRAFFFLRFSGYVSTLLVLAFIGFLSFIYIRTNKNNDTLSRTTNSFSMPAKNHNLEKIKPKLNSEKRKGLVTKDKKDLEQHKIVAEKPSVGKTPGSSVAELSILKKENIKTKGFADLSLSRSEKHSKNNSSNYINEKEIISRENSSEIKDEEIFFNSEERDSWKALEQRSLVLPYADQNFDSVKLSLSEIKKINALGKIFRKKPTLELFAGPCMLRTEVYEKNKKYTDLAYSAGIGFNFTLKQKLYLTGNFIFSRNNFTYNEQSIENKIVGREPFVSIGSSPFTVRDSIIRYQEILTQKKLSSKFSYYLNVGVGYALLQKKRFGLEASLSLGINYSTCKFKSEILQKSDTLTYLRTSTSTPLANESVISETPYEKNYKKIDLGFTPGLILSYKFTDRLALLFKPTYVSQLSRETLRYEDKLLRFKQDNLFLHLGLRITLK